MRDGDGLIQCGQGHTHWGRFGAAGLLVAHDGHVLLQHRASLTIGGDTWGVFGGARDSTESAVEAALRETAEESTLDVSTVTVRACLHEDHGGWAYDTVLGTMTSMAEVGPASWESKGAAWVRIDEVADLDLFGPFAAAWPRVRACLRRPVLVVDVANVMGSRADGWWRDRAGAAARLRDEVARVPRLTGMAPFDVAFPEKVLVVEGKARDIGAGETTVRVVPAPGDGDDQIVATVAETMAADPTAVCLVVTADRALKARCRAAGADTIGPRWLLDQL
ncbi:NUDIX domain-containing protein [Actinophytocola sediminis]